MEMKIYNRLLHKGLLWRCWLLLSAVIVLGFAVFVYNSDAFKIVDYTKSGLYTKGGNNAYNEGLWGDAGIFYQQALALNIDREELSYNLGNAYYKQGRYAEAAQVYERLLKGDVKLNRAVIYNNLGNAYYMEGMLFPSLDAYQNSLLLNDKDDKVRRNFLLVAGRLQDLLRAKNTGEKGKDKAKEDGTKTKETKPEDKNGEKMADDQSAGPYKVSDKQMNDLLKISKQQEHVPKGSKSSKQTSKNNLTGPDY